MARDLRKEINEKLEDPILRGALGKFAEQYPGARLKSYEGHDIEALREDLRAMKHDAVQHIDQLADQFEASVRERGGVVYRAKDGQAVKDYLLKICKENNVKRIVKSKSMASEEIRLNEDIEAHGIHIRETDLGEWMLSVAGQHPSHMVMPAIHLNREQCAGFFSKELKKDIPSDIPFMVQTARQVLREEFMQADLGFTGANFGVAENGATGLVTNEGNARIATTLPRINVVLIGYEKLIPKVEDISKILRLLPRNGTCQKATSYETFISGPTPVIYKKDGKWVEEDRKLYVILLDNGRLDAARDPKLNEVYQCVRCASCLNVCPIWTLVGGNVYGHIYSGGIGAILTGLLDNGLKDFSKFSDLCIGCRKCVQICPGKIPIPDIIDELRSRNVKENGMPFAEKTVFQNILTNRKVFHTLLRIGAKAQKPMTSGKFIRHLPLFFAKMTDNRSLPAIADTPFRDRAKDLEKANPQNPKMKAVFFSGCNMDFVFPDSAENAVRVLQDAGVAVFFPQEQSCCGKPAMGMGDRDTGRKLAKKNIEAILALNPDVIFSACPTCTETLEKTYVEIFEGDPAMLSKVKTFASKVREFTSLVAELYEKEGRLMPSNAGGQKVTYHDSCHIRRGLGIYKEPRALLEATPGVNFVEMKDADHCCGMAGAFGMKYVEISMPLLEKKVNNIKDTGAEVCAVACPACMMQIGGGLDKQAPNIKVKHVADILAENIAARGR